MTHRPPRSLAGLEPPAPPQGLREAALSAARQALVLESRPDVWTLLFRNPALRLAWGTAVLALATAHLLLPATARIPARGDSGDSGDSVAPSPVDPDLAAIEHLPRIDEHLLPSLKGARS